MAEGRFSHGQGRGAGAAGVSRRQVLAAGAAAPVALMLKRVSATAAEPDAVSGLAAAPVLLDLGREGILTRLELPLEPDDPPGGYDGGGAGCVEGKRLP